MIWAYHTHVVLAILTVKSYDVQTLCLLTHSAVLWIPPYTFVDCLGHCSLLLSRDTMAKVTHERKHLTGTCL